MIYLACIRRYIVKQAVKNKYPHWRLHKALPSNTRSNCFNNPVRPFYGTECGRSLQNTNWPLGRDEFGQGPAHLQLESPPLDLHNSSLAPQLARLLMWTLNNEMSVVFWGVTSSGSCKNRCFGGMYSLHHQGGKNQRAKNNVSSNFPTRWYFSAWRWGDPPKRQSLQDPRGVISQRIAFFIVTAMKTSSLRFNNLPITYLMYIIIPSSLSFLQLCLPSFVSLIRTLCLPLQRRLFAGFSQ
jgi:hypothetical protein